MLKRLVRSVFPFYGYDFLKKEYLIDKKEKEYATISVVCEAGFQKKILFAYVADEVARTHLLTEENILELMKSCRNILNELH
jgi:hypothetical protein